MWKDVLKTINRKMKLDAKFYDGELKMVFPNGSVIYLEGADASDAQMNKILGQKFRLVIIDEASKFRINIQKLIFDVLKPAVADYEGTIAMIGTADNFVASYFAKVTQGRVKGWDVHRWSALDNVHMRRQFQSEINTLRENNPNVDNEPWFKQNYLGEWVVDDNARIYHFDPETIITPLPKANQWTYVLGVSLSYTGKTAFAVLATSPNYREAFVVKTHEYDDTNIMRAVETVQDLCMTFTISSIKCLESSRKLVEELQTRYGLPISDATEQEKPALLQLFTTDLRNNLVKVLPGNSKLIHEWETVIKDEKTTRNILKEHPQSPHHLSTATVFAWGLCYNYTYQAPKTYEDPMDPYWERLEEKIKNEQYAFDNPELPF